MSFLRSYISAMRRYVSFEGRASRGALFGYLAILGLMLGIAWIVDGSTVTGRTGFFFTVGILIHLLPTLAISVRRVHDIDFSAAALLVGVIPYLGWIVLGIYAIAPTAPGSNKYDVAAAPPPLDGTKPYPLLEEVGKRVGRLGRYFHERRNGVGNGNPSVIPASQGPMGAEVVLNRARATKETETAPSTRQRLETLRQTGMLSEAEYIRLIKALV